MITTDTGAKKIEGTDNWRQIFDIHNDSVDAYDANVAALQDALGIVVDGNQSAVSASSGQFIILKNSSIVDSGDVMLADGLYTAAKAIPANTTIDKTYLTADAAGGLNALNGNLNNKLIVTTENIVFSNSIYGLVPSKSGYTFVTAFPNQAGYTFDGYYANANNVFVTSIQTLNTTVSAKVIWFKNG